MNLTYLRNKSNGNVGYNQDIRIIITYIEDNIADITIKSICSTQYVRCAKA